MNLTVTSQRIILNDGRALSFAEYGDPHGQPMMYFHGWPSSRLEAGIVESAAQRLHIRIIAPDRPGFGRSDYMPGRKLEDWPDDVVELANVLKLDRFAAVGWSGGGPYLAICALKIPHRLLSAGIISSYSPVDAIGVLDGMWRLNRWLLQIGRNAPWLFGLFSWRTVRTMKRKPDRFIAQQLSDLPYPDQAVLARAEIRENILKTGIEAFRTGSRGAALENALYARTWGFRLQDTPMKVHLWHGELDINAPPAMGRYLATAFPKCCSRFFGDEGHVSLFVNHMEEILRTLSSECGIDPARRAA